MPLNVTDRRRTAKSERSSSYSASRALSRFAITVAALSLPAYTFAAPSGTAKAHTLKLSPFVPTDDKDGDKISDSFEKAIISGDYSGYAYTIAPPKSAAAYLMGQGHTDGPVVDLVINTDHAPTANDQALIKSLGFTVKRVWSHAIDGMNVVGPLSNGITSLRQLANCGAGIVYIEPNMYYRSALYNSTTQIGARPAWTQYAPINDDLPLDGSPDISIAIVDSGLDETNPDLNGGSTSHVGGKIVGWIDEIGSNSAAPDAGYYTSPIDLDGHGTFMASVAAGTGYNSGLTTGFGYLNVGLSGPLELAPGYPVDSIGGVAGLFGTVPYDTTAWLAAGYASDASISFRATLNPPEPGLLNTFSYQDITGTTPVFVSADGGASDSVSFNQLVAGRGAGLFSGYDEDDPNYFDGGTTTTTSGTGLIYDSTDYNVAASVQAQTPMSAIGDGFNLMSGVAPQSSLVGIKALDDLGFGTTSTLITAIDDVDTNKAIWNIGVANLSMSRPVKTALDITTQTNTLVTNSQVDTAVENAAKAGIVVVAAAGNDETTTTYIAPPADSPYAITVGATSSLDAVTEYSQQGGTGQVKPDVVAPGGSIQPGSQGYITAAASNYGDLDFFPYPAAGDITTTTTTTTGTTILTQQGVGTTQGTDVDNAYETSAITPNAFLNQYTSMRGTSIAAAHVSGVVSLMEQARQIATGTAIADYGLSDTQLIKSLLEMTATETGVMAVNGTVDSRHPGTRDTFEGYGRVNAGAALSSILNQYAVGTTASGTLYNSPNGAKAWAESVSLKAGQAYTFTLTPTLNALDTANDEINEVYELYLYSGTPTSTGDPVILQTTASATDATAPVTITTTTGGVTTTAPETTTAETVSYTPVGNETDYIVIKRFAINEGDSGAFNLTSANVTTPVTLTTVTGNVTDSVTDTNISGANVVVTTGGSNNQIVARTTTNSTGGYSVTVPTGTTYFISITAPGYIAEQNQELTATPDNISIIASHTFPSGLQFVSSPFLYGSGSTMATILGITLPKVAVWDPTASEYDIYPDGATSTFTPGQGYWIRFPQTTTVQVAGVAESQSTNYVINLEAGWNMIGDPFNVTEPEANLTLTTTAGGSVGLATAISAGTTSVLYGYNSATNAYVQSIDLVPFSAYWLYTPTAATLTVTAPSNAGS